MSSRELHVGDHVDHETFIQSTVDVYDESFTGHERCRSQPPVYPIVELPRREAFIKLTRQHGVLEVVRLSSDTIHVLLERELWPDEIVWVRRLARAWWALDRVVLAVRADLRDSKNRYDAIVDEPTLPVCSWEN